MGERYSDDGGGLKKSIATDPVKFSDWSRLDSAKAVTMMESVGKCGRCGHQLGASVGSTRLCDRWDFSVETLPGSWHFYCGSRRVFLRVEFFS